MEKPTGDARVKLSEHNSQRWLQESFNFSTTFLPRFNCKIFVIEEGEKRGEGVANFNEKLSYIVLRYSLASGIELWMASKFEFSSIENGAKV